MKDVRFPPTGGEISFRVNNRVRPVIYSSYAVTDSAASSAVGRAEDAVLVHPTCA